MSTGLRTLVVMIALAVTVDPRGVTGRQAIASASISGVVVTTQDPPRPVRRAVVSLRGGDLALGHHAITDDEGRFEIKGLPAGRYDLSAMRAAFVTIAYGASRPERPGTQLALAAGQRVPELTLRLAPGAVITGIVRDDTGAPAADMEVHIQRRTSAGGLFERYARTDPQGRYRFYGLPVGPYIVSVNPLTTTAAVNHAANDAEVDAILQQLQQGRFGPPQIQAASRAVSPASLPDYAPIYYPNATTSEEAIPILLAEGMERAGVDVVIRLVSTARLVGRVVDRDGGPVASGTVQLVRASRYATRANSASLHSDGTFEFATVSPGRYQLVLWRAAPSSSSTGACEFAAASVEVAGRTPPDVLLGLRPCLKIAGRVEVASDATPSAGGASLTGVAVRFEPNRSSSDPIGNELPLLAAVGTDGTFTIGGARQLVPGSFLLQAGDPSRMPGVGWWLQSARTGDGRDILDVPLALDDSSPETTNVLLTFTNRHTSLSGSLVTAGGRPATEYTVIAFTTNREWWGPPFRRILTARPATDGSFLIYDLPPGDYFLAALAEVAPNAWLNPLILTEVAQQSVRVTIRSGDKAVQSLQIRAGGVAAILPSASGASVTGTLTLIRK